MRNLVLFLFSFLGLFNFMTFENFNGNRTLEFWEELFVKNWKKEYEVALPKSKSGDSWDIYNTSYYVDANNTIYLATKEEKYLKRSIEYVKNILDNAKPSYLMPASKFNDEYLGWVNKSKENLLGGAGEYPLFDSFC